MTNSDHGAASGRNDGWAGAFAVILIKVIDAASIIRPPAAARRVRVAHVVRAREAQ